MAITRVPLKVEKAIKDYRAAEQICAATAAWRAEIGEEISSDHPFSSVVEQAVKSSETLAHDALDKLYKLFRYWGITYEEAVMLVYGVDCETFEASLREDEPVADLLCKI